MMPTIALITSAVTLLVALLTLRRVVDTEDRLERDLDALDTTLARFADEMRAFRGKS